MESGFPDVVEICKYMQNFVLLVVIVLRIGTGGGLW
jgi:hypothetical protein